MWVNSHPPDIKAREAIIRESRRNVFVQASAGTGKTTLIVDRVMELVRNGVPLEKLAVVTFTNAAASELRSLIREKLRSRKDSDDGVFINALKIVSGAWISTIHGFASRVLKEYFNFTGVDPAFHTTEGHFTPSEIIREWDSWLFRLEKQKLTESREAIIQTGTDRQLEIALGIEELRWLDSIDRIGNSDVIRMILDEFLSKHGPLIEDMLDECIDHSDKLFGYGVEFLKGLKALKGNLSDDNSEEITGLYSIIRKHGSKKNWIDLTSAREVLAEARDEFRKIAPVLNSGKYTEQTWDFASCFADKLRRKWDSDRSRLSYSDLLYMAWKAIAGSDMLAKCLSEKFDHILIDEFQDTSSDQVSLFMAFLEQAGRLPAGSVTIVADDKQSIYGWRNADIETYRDFRDMLEKSGALSGTITTNFRSSRKIIRFVNAFGSELFGRQTSEEEVFGCDYSPIEPRPGAPEGEPVRVVTLPDIPDDLKGSYNEPAYRTILQAEWFSDYLKLGLEKGESPGDYALLIRSTTHLHHFVDVLEREGIPYFVDATRDFRSRPEITDLRELLRSVLYPHDMMAWVHSLRSLFFGISDPVINTAIMSGTTGYIDENENCPEEIRQVNMQLRRFRESVRTVPLADFLFELFFQTEMIPVITATGYQEIRRLGNLQFILEKVLSGKITTCSGLLDTLDEHLSPIKTEEPATVTRGGKAVTITTIHRAKGLAWKHVAIAAVSAKAGRGGGKNVISYDHEKKAAFKLGMPVNEKDKYRLRTPFWPEISEKNEARGRAELRRLLYVAVTRPRNSLVLFANPVEKPGKSPASILWFSLQAAQEKYPGCFIVEEIEQLEKLPFGPADRRGLTITEKFTDLEETDLFKIRMEPENWQTRGAGIGDSVHAVLQKIDFSDPVVWYTENENTLKAMQGDDYDEIRKLSLAFFRMDLPFDMEDAIVIGREYPYILSTASGLEKRYIDLLLKIDEELVVIDYKTDTFDGRTISQAAEKHMDKQLNYIQDVSEYFGLPARGYLVFLREESVFSISTKSRTP